MKIGPLNVVFHRTVRVADGAAPTALPPSLGPMEEFRVRDYAGRCPAGWVPGGTFLALHDTEALWMSFRTPGPVAVLVGAGGVNALTGGKLGTALVEGGYLVTPPQPWLDGWKAPDGTVYQFVATPHRKGEGLTVGEQLLGAESQTGAIGLSVHEAKDPAKLEGWGQDAYGQPEHWTEHYAAERPRGMSVLASMRERGAPWGEMGLGRGGKIRQRVYPDPHGIAAWRETATGAGVVYLVGAEAFQEITGRALPPPTVQAGYTGAWFGLADQAHQDLPGSAKFTGLKPAVGKDVASEPEPAPAPPEVFPADKGHRVP